MFLKHIFGAAFLLAASLLFGQAPGYMGKRLSLEADFHTLIALGGPTANNKGSTYYGDKGGGLGFNSRAGLLAGYAVSRSLQVVGGVDYFKTGMTLDLQTPTFSGDQDVDYHSLFYNLKVTTITAGYRRFNVAKGALAPLGKFGGWSLQYSRVNGEILDKKTSYSGGFAGNGHQPLGVDPKVGVWHIGYEWGTNFIIRDMFVLNFGGRFNIPLGVKSYSRLFDDQYEPNARDNPDNYAKYHNLYFKDSATFRLGMHSMLTFRAGVGVIF